MLALQLRDKILLGTNVETDDAEFLNRLVGFVDIVEVSPDRWSIWRDGESGPELQGHAIEKLSSLATQKALVVHGVGLSIGSHDGWCEHYVNLLDKILQSVPCRWHSEHLSYSIVDGESLGTMVEVPRTREALDVICARVQALQERYGIPFLLENVARAFPDNVDDQFSWASFFNSMVRRTGCGVLLDLYNLQCDEHNFGLSAQRFLDELDLNSVKEVHLAGGTLYKGFKLDIHSRRVDDETIDFAQRILTRLPAVEAVIFEVVQEAIDSLGRETLLHELLRLRRIVEQCTTSHNTSV